MSVFNLQIKYLPQSVASLIDFDLLRASAGNSMRVVVIGNPTVNKNKQKPRMVTTSSIHVREFTRTKIFTRFTE